jgi:hypothetical protein
MQSCDQYPNNSFCFCINISGESVPQYKQHNSSGNNPGKGYACCDVLHYQPAKVANIQPYNYTQFKTVYDYITLINAQDNTCDYSKYYGGKTKAEADQYMQGNYPDLYNYANLSKEIFNKYYNIDAYKNYGVYSDLIDNRDLIPKVESNNISCPIREFVPQILSYKEGTKQTEEFLYICFPKNIPYPNLEVPYTVYGITNSDGLLAKTNSINTVYSPSAAPNVGDKIYSNKKNVLSDFIIGIIVIFAVIFSVLIILYIHKTQKIRKNNLTKN